MSLEKLKELRTLRMEKAHRELQNSKEYVLFCENELAEKYHEKKRYSQWQRQHQNDLFGELQGDVFSIGALESYQINRDKMKAHRQQLKQELIALKEKYQGAERQAHEKKLALSLISKKLEKLSEIIDITEKEQNQGTNLEEEDEIDEIVAFRASC